MNIQCPYCHSDNVNRVINQHTGNAPFSPTGLAGAGIGATLAKGLSIPFSPIIGGLAGAVIGGVIDSVLQPQQQQPSSYFHCNHCQRDFQ